MRWAINKIGTVIYRLSKDHEIVIPSATYAPWSKDKSFLQIFKVIENFTLVDKYRCFELWKLIEQCKKLEDGSIIEIGVWRGGTGALMAKQAANCGISNPVFLCDTFTGVVKAGTEDPHYKDNEHANTSRQIVEELLLKKLHLNNVQILQGIFPEETSFKVENEKFRLCHIDVDVYQSAKDIIDWIWDKMVHGGIIVYDDYGFRGNAGITKYVEQQVPCKDRIVLHNLNGHALVIKI